MFNRFKNWIKASIGHARRENQAFMVLTLLIGVLVSLAVVAFIVLTERLGSRLFPNDGAAWRRLVIPVAGSLAVGYFMNRYAPDARGNGVVQTKAALYVRGYRIKLRAVLGKFFFTSATLASGIPLGPEGPAVHVGAGIASILGREAALSEEKVKALIPVGAAAAIAAAFNAPLAGVLFALEELVGDLHAPLIGSVVLSAATSWVVLRLLLGNEPIFHVPQYEFVHPIEFGIYAILGVVGGIVSVIFCRSLVRLRSRFKKLPRSTAWLQPVAGGLLVGIVGWFVPDVLGVGYTHVSEALNGHMALQLMAGLVALKLLTVVVAYASGNAGGLFAPSLFIGAMTGGAVGGVAHLLLPNQTAMPGAYALVGMGAVFAGIIRTPMTSVIMIFEVTHDYAIIVPLMIANLMSFYISTKGLPHSLYEELSLQEGVHLPASRAGVVSGHFRVSDVMRAPGEVFRDEDLVAGVLEMARASRFHAWVVVDNHGIVGLVSRADLERAGSNGAGDKLGKIVASGPFPHVHEDQSLEVALQRLGQARMEMIPVVSRANVRELMGVIRISDILEKYGIVSPTTA